MTGQSFAVDEKCYEVFIMDVRDKTVPQVFQRYYLLFIFAFHAHILFYSVAGSEGVVVLKIQYIYIYICVIIFFSYLENCQVLKILKTKSWTYTIDLISILYIHRYARQIGVHTTKPMDRL